jgi:uncharacterized protein (TIGR02996 family)
MARHPELEAKLIDNPGDVDARLIYADFLQSKGDPRGELIVLQHRGKDAEADAYIAAHADELVGPLKLFERTWDHKPTRAFEWHLGFIRSALIGYESHTDRPDKEDGDELDDLDHKEARADRAVAALLTHPSAMLLESLTVRMNMLDDGMYFDPVLQALAEHGAPALRTLRLGEFQQAGPGGVQNDYDYENSWAGFGNGTAVWAKLPRLENLRLQMNFGGYSTQGITDEIGEFDLPKLAHLEVVTGGMSRFCLRSFASGKLPALRFIDLWIGSNNYGSDGSVEDLAPLLAGDNVPSLTHLGIINCEFTDDVVTALVHSKLLPRLRELSLAHGMMTDAGAAALVKHADAFQHLDLLDVSGNYVREQVANLRVCKRVIDKQRAWDDEYRYVALSE